MFHDKVVYRHINSRWYGRRAANCYIFWRWPTDIRKRLFGTHSAFLYGFELLQGSGRRPENRAGDRNQRIDHMEDELRLVPVHHIRLL